MTNPFIRIGAPCAIAACLLGLAPSAGAQSVAGTDPLTSSLSALRGVAPVGVPVPGPRLLVPGGVGPARLGMTVPELSSAVRVTGDGGRGDGCQAIKAFDVDGRIWWAGFNRDMRLVRISGDPVTDRIAVPHPSLGALDQAYAGWRRDWFGAGGPQADVVRYTDAGGASVSFVIRGGVATSGFTGIGNNSKFDFGCF